MQNTSPETTQCPVARSLGCFGDAWSMLILRDAYYGMTRFDEWERSLGIAPNILTKRLKALVANGLMERRCYRERPQRYEYRLTEAGWDARSVIVALLAWGNRHLAPEGLSVVLVNAETGEPADPVMVDANTGRPLSMPEYCIGTGPGAGRAIRERVANSPRRWQAPAETANADCEGS